MLLICAPLLNNAQIHADPEYYLIDSLVLEELPEVDSNLIVNYLGKYHNAKDDTSRLYFIDSLIEACYNENIWPKYNYWIYKHVKNQLQTEVSPTLIKYYKTSLAGALNNIGYLYSTQSNYPKAIEFYDQSLAASEEINDKETIATTLNNTGYIYDILGNNIKALEYYHKSLRIRKEIGNKKGIANSLNNLSTVYQSQGNIPKAIDFCHRALKIREEIDDKNDIASSLNNLAFLYDSQGDMLKAMELNLKSLKIKEEIGHKSGVASSLNNIASIYNSQEKHDQALIFYLKSLRIREDINDKEGIGYSLNNIGDVYRRLGKDQKALEHYYKSLKINEEIGNKKTISICLNSIGDILFSFGNVNEAEKYANRSLVIAREIGVPENIQNAAQLLSNIYEKQNKGMQALKMHQLFVAMKDSINNDVSKKVLIQQQTNYEYEKQKTLDDAERDKLIAIEQEKKEKQQILTAAAAIGLLFVLSFLIFIVNRLKTTRKQKLIIERQKDVVEIAHQKLGEKNKEILDSIAYAKRIQSAILPSNKIVKAYLQESFILYLPKDIVAGDFYWMENKSNKILFAAADCTGHGVPGAMVSVVCNNALNRSVREYGLTDPGEILNKTREIVIQEFEKSDKEVQDGMDIALCSLEDYHLQYAGAHNPLWIIRDGQIIETKADKQPIGKFINQTPYHTHSFNLQKNDSIYIFSDGYVDQFGGEYGKKFKAKVFRELLLSIQDQPMTEQQKTITNTFNNWKGELEQIDDVCVIGVKIS